MKKLVAAGDNCIDNYAVEGMVFAGGNPVNVAVSLVRNGGEASYVGAVGDDDNGKFLVTEVERVGVNVSRVHVLPGKTAITEVTMAGEERILGDYDEGVLADFRLSGGDLRFVGEHDLFFTGLWGNLEGQLGDVRALKVPVAFDFATEIVGSVAEATLPQVDIAFFSDDREGSDPELRALLARVASRGPGIAVATLGERGSLAFRDGEYFFAGVVPTAVVDTMGAGDSYIGGFFAGYLVGVSIVECMERGTRSAAQTVSISGAW